jgi:hypothetical protein
MLMRMIVRLRLLGGHGAARARRPMLTTVRRGRPRRLAAPAPRKPLP